MTPAESIHESCDRTIVLGIYIYKYYNFYIFRCMYSRMMMWVMVQACTGTTDRSFLSEFSGSV